MKEGFVLRPATLAERKMFYKQEFSVARVKAWFRLHHLRLPQICALDAGSETGVIKNKNWKNVMFYFPFAELQKKIMQYIPEDVYYDRNVYADPEKVLRELRFSNPLAQELAFDIDSDNIPCVHRTKQSACKRCIKKAYAYALEMQHELKKTFQRVIVVYSGRGFHMHVLDKKAWSLSFREREQLNKKFSRYPLDPWVSRGYIGLIRMPFSLNGLVSRTVIPLYDATFAWKSTIPKFLRDS